VAVVTGISPLPPPVEKRAFVGQMFDAIAPRYDLMNRLMTLGLDRVWRQRTLAALEISPGCVVVDLGCGTGDLSAGARALGAVAVGVDLSAGMLAVARRRGDAPTLLRADATRLPIADASCDGAVSGFALRNFVSIEAVLDDCARVMKPGGRIALLEIDRPERGAFAAFFDVYFRRVMPMLGALVSRGYAYRYLASSTAYLPPWAQLRAMLERAGFREVVKRSMTAGTVQLVTAIRSESR
jgi:demethylmenaquinone methyltransferase/2-methoxy-6-polyprenyl-1,4-benzoquinol methylase